MFSFIPNSAPTNSTYSVCQTEFLQFYKCIIPLSLPPSLPNKHTHAHTPLSLSCATFPPSYSSHFFAWLTDLILPVLARPSCSETLELTNVGALSSLYFSISPACLLHQRESSQKVGKASWSPPGLQYLALCLAHVKHSVRDFKIVNCTE